MVGLQSRTAVVTGAGRGIGRATAIALAEAGARVAVLARSSSEISAASSQLLKAGHRAIGVNADVSDLGSLRTAFEQVAAELGPVDVLVNNAGVTWPLGPTAEVDSEEWMAAVSVNLGGALRCSRLVLPGMVERGWGRIVNVTTGAARPPGLLRASAYSASKAGLNQLTLNLAAELQDTGVNVCAVDPGPIDTGMQDFMRSQSELLGPEVGAMFHRFHETGQLRDPTEPARLIAVLAASEVTGEIVGLSSDRAAQLLAGG